MAFYNVTKLREEFLRKDNNSLLHELEIDGVNQDDDDDEEDVDYTGDDGGEDDDYDEPDNDYTVQDDDVEIPEPEEEPENDYTMTGEDDDNDTRTDPENAGGDGEEGAGDPENVGGDGEDGMGGDDQETSDETDYTIPDDAEPETPETAGEDQGAADDVEGEDNDYTAEDEPADPAADAGGDTGASSPPADEDSESSNDYTTDSGGDGGEDAGDTGEGNAEGEPGETEGSVINDELKAAEDELLADLSDEQKQIQSDELRKNFIDLYNIVLDVIDKVNNIHKEESTLQVFEFISTQLLILKDIINTNITRSFDTKTYIENNIDYQHCLAILNSVKQMIEETDKKSQKLKEA